MINAMDLLKKRSQQSDKALSEEEVHEYLTTLKGWTLDDNRLVKTFNFRDYYETMAFVNAIAYIVHAENHHPDLLTSFNRCVVMLSTHSADQGRGGISENDFICAVKIDAMAGYNFAPVAH